jgi:hypothetical protein
VIEIHTTKNVVKVNVRMEKNAINAIHDVTIIHRRMTLRRGSEKEQQEKGKAQARIFECA